MGVLLTVSYVLHVVSAALWTGSVLYVVYAVVPGAVDGEFAPAPFVAAVDGVLQVTRWTGVVLPLTGAYQVWTLYSLDALVGTPRGHLVVAMAALWGAMNGVVELGVWRMRTGASAPSFAEHFVTPLRERDVPDASSAAATGRPYFLAAAGLAVVLLADAALLSAGVPW